MRKLLFLDDCKLEVAQHGSGCVDKASGGKL